MANYIGILQNLVAEADARQAAALEALEDFRADVLSPKHQGTATDGTRNDWISTADVLRRLEEIRRALTE